MYRHIFGLKGNVKDNVLFVDETTVVYPAGNNIVIYHTEQRTQKFIQGSPDGGGFTALALSPSRKYLAAAEKQDKGQITVYDLHTLKRRKLLSIVGNEVQTSQYVSLAFSADGKTLAAQGAAPDWVLVLWTWEKSKVLAMTKTTNQQGSPVYQCAFNPFDNNVVSCVGHNIFKLYRIVDGLLKVQPSVLGKREPQNFTCHAWLPDEKENILVGTDSGELILVENGEVKASLVTTTEGNSIESLTGYSKGFVCGRDHGILSVYEKFDEKDYKISKTYTIDNNPFKVQNLAISPSEETVVCTLENNQMFMLGLSNSDLLKPDDPSFELLSQSFHSQAITGVDVCIRKPLVATCSIDKSVRVWNYVEKSADLLKTFPEESYSVAFHPSGMHILVGFADKLRLMNLLMDDIRTFKEFSIKACRECRFSNGGQYFAAVNGNTIQLYNTYTCENIGTLRGHNGKVRSVFWVADDTRLISAGMDGAVYEWRLKDFRREKENVLKGCNYTCIIAAGDSHSIAIGSDLKLKEFDDAAQIIKEYDAGTLLTQIVLPSSSRVLFAATDAGTVRCYKFPLTGEFQEFQCHSAAITRMAINHDDSMLFCVGEDGILAILDVRDKDGKTGKRDKDAIVFAEEVLITKSDLEEKKTRMAELETQVNELTLQNDYQLQLKDLNLNEKIKDITEKFTNELENDKVKFDQLLQEKNEQELDYEEKIKQAEERAQAASATLETQYQQRIMAEVERYQQLMQEKEMLSERWDEQVSVLVESHERVIQELTEEYEGKIQEEQMNSQQVHQEKEENLREFEETKRQLEEDTDREIEELKERYEVKLAAEREIGLRLKGENGIMKKKFHALQKDIDDQKEEIKQLFEQKKELYQTISSLEKDINSLKKEIKERDETIGDKEKRIYDLKKKNQELEKFKFVLDYKIKELKKQIEPRELEISDMKEQIKEMDHELERYHKNNANLDLNISDLKLKLEGLQQEVLIQRKRSADANAIIRCFNHDLYETGQHIQDPKALKESVKHLYQKHLTENVRPFEMEEDIQKEYNRQREYLEKSVESLKRKLQKDMELHRSDNMRIMQENVSLIKEINELRREVKVLRSSNVKRGNEDGGQGRKREESQRSGRSAANTSAGTNGDTSKNTQLVNMIETKDRIIRDLQERLASYENVANKRPMSRERLPQMDI